MCRGVDLLCLFISPGVLVAKGQTCVGNISNNLFNQKDTF